MAEHHHNTNLASILHFASENPYTAPMQSHHEALPDGWDGGSGIQLINSLGHHFHPKQILQLNLTDMYTEQGIQHLLTVLQYGHSLDNLMGRLIRGSLETMTLKLRSLQNPFTQDYTEMHSLVTNLWIKTVWQFQHHHAI